MSINRALSEAAGHNEIINEAVDAALRTVRDFSGDYLPEKYNDGRREAMPHEWGSIDRYDDMRNCLGIAYELIGGLFDAYEDEEAQREFVRRAIRDHSVCAVESDLMQLAFPVRSKEEDKRLSQLEAAFAEAGGRGVEMAEELDCLRVKRWTEQLIEDYLYTEDRP